MTEKFVVGGVTKYYTEHSLPYSWNPAGLAPFDPTTALSIFTRDVAVHPTNAPHGKQSFNALGSVLAQTVSADIDRENINIDLHTANGVLGTGNGSSPLQLVKSFMDGKYRVVGNQSHTFVVSDTQLNAMRNNNNLSSFSSNIFTLSGLQLSNPSAINVLHKAKYGIIAQGTTITLTNNAVNYIFIRLVGDDFTVMHTTTVNGYNSPRDILLGTVNTNNGTVDVKAQMLWDGFNPANGLTEGGVGTIQLVSLDSLIPTIDLGWYNNSSGTGNKISSTNEGTTAYLIAKTTNMANGVALPLSFTGSATLSDVSMGSWPTTLTVNSNMAVSPAFTFLNDATTEGNETLTATIVSGISAALTINDTSTTPAPEYVLSRSASSVNEGSSVTITLTYTNNVNTGNVAYNISGVQAEDINLALSGNFSLPVGNGTRTWTITAAADSLTEGAETLTFSIPSMSQSISVTINDTSKPTYSLSWRDLNGNIISTANEGQTVHLRISFTNAPPPPSETVVIDFSGTGITINDFGEQPSSLTNHGPFYVNNLNGANSYINAFIIIAHDGTLEGNESLTARLKVQGTSTYLATSPVLTINDTPTYSVNIYTDSSGTTLAPPYLSSDTNYYVVVKTTNVPNGTQLRLNSAFTPLGYEVTLPSTTITISNNIAATVFTTGKYDTNLLVTLRNQADTQTHGTSSRFITNSGYYIDFADYIAYVNEIEYGGGPVTRVFANVEPYQMFCNKYSVPNLNSVTNVLIIVPNNCFITGGMQPYLTPNADWDYESLGGPNDIHALSGINFPSNIWDTGRSSMLTVKIECYGAIVGHGGDQIEYGEDPILYNFGNGGGTAVTNYTTYVNVIVNVQPSGLVAGGGGGGGGSGGFVAPNGPTLNPGERSSWDPVNDTDPVSSPNGGGGGYPYGRGWVDGGRASRTGQYAGGAGYSSSINGGNLAQDGGSPGTGSRGLRGRKKYGNVTFTGVTVNVYGRD